VRDYIYIAPLSSPPENPFLGTYGTDVRLIASVAHDFGILPSDITGKSRLKHLVDARAVVATILKVGCGESYAEAGRVIGGRDHSTTINSVVKFPEYSKRNPKVQASYDRHLALIEEAERIHAGQEGA
jgi:hypothetical protein